MHSLALVASAAYFAAARAQELTTFTYKGYENDFMTMTPFVLTGTVTVDGAKTVISAPGTQVTISNGNTNVVQNNAGSNNGATDTGYFSSGSPGQTGSVVTGSPGQSASSGDTYVSGSGGQDGSAGADGAAATVIATGTSGSSGTAATLTTTTSNPSITCSTIDYSGLLPVPTAADEYLQLALFNFMEKAIQTTTYPCASLKPTLTGSLSSAYMSYATASATSWFSAHSSVVGRIVNGDCWNQMGSALGNGSASVVIEAVAAGDCGPGLEAANHFETTTAGAGSTGTATTSSSTSTSTNSAGGKHFSVGARVLALAGLGSVVALVGYL